MSIPSRQTRLRISLLSALRRRHVNSYSVFTLPLFCWSWRLALLLWLQVVPSGRTRELEKVLEFVPRTPALWVTELRTLPLAAPSCQEPCLMSSGSLLWALFPDYLRPHVSLTQAVFPWSFHSYPGLRDCTNLEVTVLFPALSVTCWLSPSLL